MHTPEVSVFMIDDSRADAVCLNDLLQSIEAFDVNFCHVKQPDNEYLRSYLSYFDVAFIDYRFEGAKNGIELVEELRGIDYQGPIYVITGRGNETIKQQCLEAGGNGYFEKESISVDLLEGIVEDYLYEREAKSI